jgi:acyl carrier protein
VLDRHMQPVPIGIPGELYIGGAGLARGYLHQPELSAERFVPHPWSDVGGARLYRTGDLVCYRPDGTLAFLGRADTQVKLRGLRIELGEIETVLADHPTVLDAIVLVRKDIFGDQHLVAYVAPHPQQIFSVRGLLDYLKAKLPDYMVPSTIIKLETLPLTPNGKIDRHKLPAFEGLDRTLETAYVAPQTELEQVIASIWQKVLHIEQIGVHDNFFDLGGHSLLLARIHSDLRTLLHNGIVLIDLFKYPTISSLAAYISQKQPEAPPFQRSIKRAETRRGATQRQRQYRQQNRTPS